jgi:hypothetical protein
MTMLTIPMTDAQFAAVSARLAKNGIEVSGTSGTLTKDGVTAKYEHVGDTLNVDVVDRPFFLPLSMIEGRLKAFFEQSIAAGDGPVKL